MTSKKANDRSYRHKIKESETLLIWLFITKFLKNLSIGFYMELNITDTVF
jgi:hypothetical protein